MVYILCKNYPSYHILKILGNHLELSPYKECESEKKNTTEILPNASLQHPQFGSSLSVGCRGFGVP